MRPYTTVDMMDKLGTFAGQQHQDLSAKYRFGPSLVCAKFPRLTPVWPCSSVGRATVI